MTTLGEVAGTTVRVARPGDDAALRRLIADTAMPGRPSITQEREPDFFALPRLQAGPRGRSETYVAEDSSGRLVACGTLVARDGWVAGRLRRVGHVGDLRVAPSHRGARLLPGMGRLALTQGREALGVGLCFAATLAGNRRIASAVEGARAGARRAEQPPGHAAGGYAMVTVLRPPPRPPAGIAVRSAEEADLPAISRFLQDGHRHRPFAEDHGEATLRWRLRTWPGLRVEEFRLAERDGRLVGCGAPWDPSPVRQTRITAWGAAAPWRAWQDALRSRAGLAPLPRDGDLLRLAYLTHAHAAEGPEGAAASAALAADGWRWAAGRGLHGLALQRPLGERPARAGLPRWSPRTSVAVHAVALPDVQVPPLSGFPGVEMALA